MSKLRLSLVITFLSTNGSTAVNFIVTLILARLLSPSDIGIFSITSVVVSIAHIFRDFGVTNYLLREKELTPEKIRSAFGVLIATSWVIALALFAISIPASAYFAEPGITPVMRVLAFGFLFIPFGAITHTLLTRQLRAKEQALINIFGTTAYASSAVLLAWYDFGYMSLAWANVINIIVTGLASAPFRPKDVPWRPTLNGWKEIAHFGSGAVLSNSISAINSAISDVFLGKMKNAHDVGLYSRANGTASIFMQVAGPTINYAALTHLSSSFHQTGNITPQLSKATAYLSVFAFPILGLTSLYARDVILFLYGEKWAECIPLLPYTCAIIAIGLSAHFLGASLTAIGRPYLAIIPSLSSLLTRILVLLLVFDGSLLSFAIGMLGGSIVTVPIFIWLQQRFLHFPLRVYIESQAKSAGITVLVCAVGELISLLLPTTLLPIFRLSIMALFCSATWWFGLVRFKHPFRQEIYAMLPSRFRPETHAD